MKFEITDEEIAMLHYFYGYLGINIKSSKQMHKLFSKLIIKLNTEQMKQSD